MRRPALLCVALAACGGDEMLSPRTVRLNVTGTVTARATGAPIADASVDLWRSFIGSGYIVAPAERGAAGAYTLRFDAICASGSTDHGYILVARAPGYQDLSDINIGRRLVCTASPQRIDFALAPAP
jgi:hypothetical protein